jgi:hypothetical protein
MPTKKKLLRGSMTHSMTISTEDDHEIEATFSFDGHYHKAKTSGPPENCEPEDAEVNVYTVEPDGEPEVDFDDWVESVKLTAKDVESIEERLMEVIREDDGGREDYEYDRLRDEIVD